MAKIEYKRADVRLPFPDRMLAVRVQSVAGTHRLKVSIEDGPICRLTCDGCGKLVVVADLAKLAIAIPGASAFYDAAAAAIEGAAGEFAKEPCA